VSPLDELPLREDLRGKHAYGAPQLPEAIQLNVNENPYPPSASLVADIASACAVAATSLNRYPDRDAVALRSRLAAYLGHGLGVDRVWAANGSNEILQQILMTFGGPGRVALGFEPSYSMHRLISEATSTGWVAAARAADFTLPLETAVRAVELHRPDIVFLTSPNNPTGGAIDPAVIRAVLDVAPGMVIVDEAYAEFGHASSALALLPERPRLIVTRTMSKAFALAGARVGYLGASAAVVEALQLVRLPYHLSAMTQAVALTALEHLDELLGTVDAVIASRERIKAGLDALGCATVPTESNFLLFGRFRAPAHVWQALLDHGVLVRDVSGGPGLSGWLRVCAGTEDECTAFLAAAAKVFAPADIFETQEVFA